MKATPAALPRATCLSASGKNSICRDTKPWNDSAFPIGLKTIFTASANTRFARGDQARPLATVGSLKLAVSVLPINPALGHPATTFGLAYGVCSRASMWCFIGTNRAAFLFPAFCTDACCLKIR